MIKVCFLTLIPVVFLTWDGCSGSKVTLTASTPAIQPLLTPTLSLRCSVEDTSSSSSVVGRSLSLTPNNVKFVTSMFLYKDDEDIATISEHTQAHAVNGSPNLNISGAIPGSSPGEKGFLEVTMNYPTEAQGGNFTCRISGIDDVGHAVSFSKSVGVDVTVPTITDLVHHIMVQDQKNRQEIAFLKNQNQIQDQRIHQLEDELAVARHVEGGVVSCGGNLGTVSHAQLSRTAMVNFTAPYRYTPMVHVAVNDAGINKEYYGYFRVTLVQVDAQGFTVECKVANGAHYLNYLELSWLSFPA